MQYHEHFSLSSLRKTCPSLIRSASQLRLSFTPVWCFLSAMAQHRCSLITFSGVSVMNAIFLSILANFEINHIFQKLSIFIHGMIVVISKKVGYAVRVGKSALFVEILCVRIINKEHRHLSPLPTKRIWKTADRISIRALQRSLSYAIGRYSRRYVHRGFLQTMRIYLLAPHTQLFY